jgi:DNA-binding MarR family transcriptional regulator
MTKKKSSDEAPFAYAGLDRVIHERARLSILTSLMTHANGLSFVELKRLCALTDGNLARHLQVLEEESVVRLSKEGEGARAQTTVRITGAGKKRYMEYLTILEQIMRDAVAATEASEKALERGKLSLQVT